MPLSTALTRAQAENKLLFVQLQSADCRQCNDVGAAGVDDSKVVQTMANDFLFLLVPPASPDYETLSAKHRLQFGTLFLDASGSLIHLIRSTNSQGTMYTTEAGKALQNRSAVAELSAMEEQFKAGNRSFTFLEKLVQKRMQLSRPADEVMKEYVYLLPDDSLQSLSSLRFIARTAPVLGSDASTKLRRDQDLFNQAWYSIPLQERIQINQLILGKTKAQAIRNKDEKLARQLATFGMQIMDDRTAGYKMYNNLLLDYFAGVKDTTNWVRQAVPFYEQYYSQPALEKWKQEDSLIRERAFRTAKKDTLEGYKTQVVRSTAVIPMASSGTASALTNAAANLYKMARESNHKIIALRWSEQATKIFPGSSTFSSYAILLYKDGKKTDAMQWMEKAVAEAKEKQPMMVKYYEDNLQLMRSDKPVD